MTGASARSAASTRSCSAIVRARTSTKTDADAGTVLVVVPDVATVGVTVVPWSGSASSVIASTVWASSTVALTPRSGSRPAWAARPVTTTSYSDTPLRSILRAPPGADASSTSAPRAPRAVSSMSAREVVEPTSSSPVTSSVTPSRSGSDAIACSAMTRPAFMSKQPGPVRTPSRTRNGRRSSVPTGHTVSWWVTSTTRVSAPKRQRRCVTPSITMRSGSTPSSSSPSAATSSAERATAQASADGDSTETSRSMCATIVSVRRSARVSLIPALRPSRRIRAERCSRPRR